MNEYEKIVKYYGKDHQITKAIEEMAELIQALSKYLTSKKFSETEKSIRSVQEELADVDIMLHQLLVIFGSEGHEERKAMKIQRTFERMEANDD